MLCIIYTSTENKEETWLTSAMVLGCVFVTFQFETLVLGMPPAHARPWASGSQKREQGASHWKSIFKMQIPGPHLSVVGSLSLGLAPAHETGENWLRVITFLEHILGLIQVYFSHLTNPRE